MGEALLGVVLLFCSTALFLYISFPLLLTVSFMHLCLRGTQAIEWLLLSALQWYITGCMSGHHSRLSLSVELWMTYLQAQIKQY